jgi:hypothetical protein
MTTDIEGIRDALDRNQPDAVQRLRAAVAAARASTGGHGALAHLCERAGEFGLALTEYQLAVRDDPRDAVALSRLVVLHEERGEVDEAVRAAERWRTAAPDDGDAWRAHVRLLAETDATARAREVADEASRRGLAPDLVDQLMGMADVRGGDEASEPDVAPGMPTDADVVRFLHLFAGRENVHARQWQGQQGEGGYSPVKEPLTVKVAREHLLGNVTVGAYVVRLDDSVTFFAFDLDITKRAMARARSDVREARRLRDDVAKEACAMQAALSELALPSLLEDSGYKGRHVWVFLDGSAPAEVVRLFGSLFLGAHPMRSRDISVEFFPKQSRVESGLGNLIKLPLGIHRKTGRRSRLLAADGTAVPDPFAVLRAQPRATLAALHAAVTALKARAPAPAVSARPDADEGEAAATPASAVPAPPAPAPAWTSADFETDREVAHVLRGCAVLAALKDKAERHRRLTHDEQVVLRHALGHSAPGVLAVNYLLDQCLDVAPSARLQSPLAGNPISCPRVRKRIPAVTGAVPCNCHFETSPEQYPHPRLHLLTLPSAVAAPARPARERAWDAADRARSLGVLWSQRERVQREIADLEEQLLEHLRTSGADAIDTGDGKLVLVHEEGAPPALRWQPAAAGPGAAGSLAEPKREA